MTRTNSSRSPGETIIVLMIAGILVYLRYRYISVLWIVLGLAVVSILIPAAAKWIHRGWFWLARILGGITGKVLLSVIYILFVLPIAFMLKRKFSAHFKRHVNTYFFTRDHEYTKNDVEHPW